MSWRDEGQGCEEFLEKIERDLDDVAGVKKRPRRKDVEQPQSDEAPKEREQGQRGPDRKPRYVLRREDGSYILFPNKKTKLLDRLEYERSKNALLKYSNSRLYARAKQYLAMVYRWQIDEMRQRAKVMNPQKVLRHGESLMRWVTQQKMELDKNLWRNVNVREKRRSRRRERTTDRQEEVTHGTGQPIRQG